MKKCALYTRVSTVRQAMQRDGSLDNQLARLRAYVEYKNMTARNDERWEVVGEYIDKAESGKDLDRPKLKELLSAIERGEVTTVLTVKIDRISRSLRDFFSLWDFFEKHSTDFISLSDNFDTGTAMGRAALKLILVFAELERETTGERTASTMAYRATQGLRNGGRILGYDLNPQNKGIPLVNREQAALVRDIYARYLEFGSVGKVVRYLSGKGVMRPVYTSRRGRENGGGPFGVQTVINILRNEFYVGRIVHKGETYDGQHEAIIDQVTWDRVQALLGKEGERPRGLPGVPRRRNADAPLHIYKLKGMLRCAKCGSFMTPTSGTNSTGKNYFYYECTRHAHVGTEACSTPYLPAVAIEELIVGRLREIANDEAALRELTHRANEDQAKAAAELEERERRLEKRLNALRERIAPLLELIETKGRAALPSIEERLGKLESERRTLDEELKLAAHERRLLEERTLRVEVVVDAYRALREALASDDAKTLESVLPTIVETITWTPENNGRGGCYRIALYENPLELQGLRVPGEPARDACSLLEGVWLPGSDARRAPRSAVRPARLYLEGRAWSVRVDRQPRFSVEPPQESICSLRHLKRCWHKNPIATAVEMKAALDALATPSARLLAPQFGVTRSRVAQLLGLLRLPQAIIDFMLDGGNEVQAGRVSEGNLRRILMLRDPALQCREFEKLLAAAADADRRRPLSRQPGHFADEGRMAFAAVGA